MGNYTIWGEGGGGVENPSRGRQARNLTTNVPKILDLKLSEQTFSKNCRWVPLKLGGIDSENPTESPLVNNQKYKNLFSQARSSRFLNVGYSSTMNL